MEDIKYKTCDRCSYDILDDDGNTWNIIYETFK